MNKNHSPELINLEGWPFRVSKASQRSTPSKVLILLHGHLGNENVMWIFTKPLPDDYTILSPRAPQKMGPDQFSWHKIGLRWPDLNEYQDLFNQLLKRIEVWLEENEIQAKQFDLMGFSQGAVMAYAMAISHPEIIRRVAVIAGFIPNTWGEQIEDSNLKGKQFFIAHGTKDDIIPIRKAYRAQKWLENHGAQVNFCEAEIGHKLSAGCFNGLEDFFT